MKDSTEHSAFDLIGVVERSGRFEVLEQLLLKMKQRQTLLDLISAAYPITAELEMMATYKGFEPKKVAWRGPGREIVRSFLEVIEAAERGPDLVAAFVQDRPRRVDLATAARDYFQTGSL